MNAEMIHARRWWALGVMCLSLLVIGLDNTILNVALPALVTRPARLDQPAAVDRRRLHPGVRRPAAHRRQPRATASAARAPWASAWPSSAPARWPSAIATSATQLIVTRAFMGIGAALDHAGHAVAAHQRLHRPAGAGPGHRRVGGGRRRRRRHRPAARRLPAAALLVGLGVPRQRAGHHRGPRRRPLPAARLASDPSAPRLDPIGAVLSIVGLVRRPVGHHRGAHRGLDRPARRRRLRRSASSCWPAFVLWELHSDHPMLDVRFFENRRFTAANVAITMMFFAMFGSMFLITQYLQTVLGFSALAGRAAHAADGVRHDGGGAAARPRLVERVGTKLVVGGGLLLVAVRHGGGVHRARRPTATRTCFAAMVDPVGRHGPGHGPGHRVDHGLAAAGQGRRRLGHERHHPPDGRRPRRRRHRLGPGHRLPARRDQRPHRPRGAGGHDHRRPGLGRRRRGGGRRPPGHARPGGGGGVQDRVRRRLRQRPPGGLTGGLGRPPPWCSSSCPPAAGDAREAVEGPLDGLASLTFAEAEGVLEIDAAEAMVPPAPSGPAS